MAITKFQFEDTLNNWKLAETSFDSFNLLVGLSGVGKTRILKALEAVRDAGLELANKATSCKWQLEFIFEGHTYNWKAEVSKASQDIMNSPNEKGKEESDNAYFIREIILLDGKDVLVDRSEVKFTFNNTPTLKLDKKQSVIRLLKEEDLIKPIFEALAQIISTTQDLFYGAITDPFSSNPDLHIPIEQLRKATDIFNILRGYILQEKYPQEFKKIKDSYCEIFPLVSDVKYIKLNELDLSRLTSSTRPDQTKILAIKEKGIKNWLIMSDISEGMKRTLAFILELALAPPDSVILIDEIENSMGLNCLSPIIERFKERHGELQFIITSHHPYIINNIQPKWWKLVTRKGSKVQVKDYNSLPALHTKSAHDKFTLLTNLPEYEEGIQ